jgi:hypothetical protein
VIAWGFITGKNDGNRCFLRERMTGWGCGYGTLPPVEGVGWVDG